MARSSRLTAVPRQAGTEPAPPGVLGPDIVALLGQPLDPKLIARRKGPHGGMVGYIEGHRAIDQANRVFGFGGWGGEVVGEIRYRDLSFSGEQGEPAGMYWATVRITVRDCEARSDVGCGFATEPTVEAHDTAIKSAVTDGLKRALRQFYVRWNTKHR